MTVEEGQRLESNNTKVVKVAPKAGSTTIWVVTGVQKGAVTVDIFNADGTVADTISVTIENTPPTRGTMMTMDL